MCRLRSLEHTGGSNPNERAVESRQNAWSHGKNELLVHAPAQLGESFLAIPHCPFHFGEYSAIQSLIGFPKQPEQRLVLHGEMHHEGLPLPRDAEHMNPHKILEDPARR